MNTVKSAAMKGVVVMGFFLFLTACGKEERALKKNIDPSLRPILNEYVEANGEGLLSNLLSLEYGEPGEENEAITLSFRRDGDVFSRVVVRPQDNGCLLRRAVWHELGHALHNLEHTSNKDDVMYAELVGASASWCASMHLKLKEMFR